MNLLVNKWIMLYNKIFPWMCIMEYGFDFNWIRLSKLKWYPIRIKEIEIPLSYNIIIRPYILHINLDETNFQDSLSEYFENIVYIGKRIGSYVLENNTSIFVIKNKKCNIEKEKKSICLHKHTCLIAYGNDCYNDCLTFDSEVMHYIACP